MAEKTLFELLDEVSNEKSFLNFIEELHKDRVAYVENKAEDEWQNDTIETFLERAHSWGEASIDGLKYYNKPNNIWKRCAQILYMGKIYE